MSCAQAMRWLIVIPAWNEEASLPHTLQALTESGYQDVVVIDDGSSDRTAGIAVEFGVKVISLPQNLGIGAAMQTGFKYAVIHGYDGVVQCDADGQHPASDIRQLCQAVEAGDCDVAMGSRFLEPTRYAQSVSRRLGARWFTWLLKRLSGWHLSDPTSGFRAINHQVLVDLARDYAPDYPEVEALGQFYRGRFKVKEISVEMNRREQGESSIKSFGSFYYMIKVSLALILSHVAPQKEEP